MKTAQNQGFTVVELLIVIIVIAILAAIAIVSYRGIQARATESLLDSDLHNAQQQMEIAYVQSEQYPTALPSTIRTSDKVTLTLVQGGQKVYHNLTAGQNGVLFYDTCQQLLAEGVGAKPDDNHDYISACTVSSYNQIHINGWNGRNVNTPVTVAALASYVNSYTGGSAAEFKSKGQAFMDTLATRFQASGGTFPVSEFWDSWATPTNGGRVKPTLPAPTITGGADSYCIQATYQGSTLVKHINKAGNAQAGAC